MGERWWQVEGGWRCLGGSQPLGDLGTQDQRGGSIAEEHARGDSKLFNATLINVLKLGHSRGMLHQTIPATLNSWQLGVGSGAGSEGQVDWPRRSSPHPDGRATSHGLGLSGQGPGVYQGSGGAKKKTTTRYNSNKGHRKNGSQKAEMLG